MDSLCVCAALVWSVEKAEVGVSCWIMNTSFKLGLNYTIIYAVCQGFVITAVFAIIDRESPMD